MSLGDGMLREVLDHLGRGIWVVLAETGEAVDVNQTMSDWLGYSREELLHLGPRGIEVEYGIQSDEQYRAQLEALRRTEKGAAPYRNARLRRKDGTTILADVSASLHEADGVEYVVALVRDVGEVRKAEQEARLTQLAVDKAAEAMFRVGADARILACNQTASDRLGYAKAELLTMRIFDLDPNYGPEVWPEHWTSIRQQRQICIETVQRKKDGSVFPVEVSISYIPAGPLNEEQCCSFIRDITERKALERRLQRADRMTTIGTLAAGVAHEINNPMQYVRSSIDALNSDYLGEKKRQEALDDALQGCIRVRNIVGNLQALSRTDEPRLEPVSIHATLNFAIKVASNHFRHRARLRQHHGDLALHVLGDSGRLGQVFVNILVNAGQAFETDESGNEIVVRTSEKWTNDDERRVVIEVMDNGCGIPADIQDRIYDAFYTTKPMGVGSGLGLSITQSIVSQLNGLLDIQSVEGEGTMVRIELPWSEPAASKSVPTADAEPANLKVLIVDDDEVIVRAFRRILSAFHVESATDARAARQALAEHDFDVVLCDVMMPEVSGPQLYALAAQDDAKWRDRFVFLTGGACTEQAREFLETTECQCLTKPIDMNLLRNTIAAFQRS